MPKGVEKDALGSYGNATGQANNAYNVANPIYTQEAKNPQGYSPQQMANMTTASLQSLGGANASAAGQGALQAARTNNAGGYQAAIDDAARGAGQQQSQNVLDLQNKSAGLQRQQQQEGLAGLAGIYSDANSNARGYLGEADNAAQNNPWMKILLTGMQGASSAASAYMGKPGASAGAGGH